MASGNEFMRYASPNEQRTISREDLGFYYAVIIGAVYELKNGMDLASPRSYFHALEHCINQHPFLCVVVGDANTDKAYYERVPTVNLEDHISIVDASSAGKDETASIQQILAGDLDRPFLAGTPPWRIVVLPLASSRCFIAFSYSHTIGDGPSGAAFHRSFLEAFKTTSAEEAEGSQSVVSTPKTLVPDPFDTAERLPITWSFLLAPLIASRVPAFIASYLGLRSDVGAINAETWTGAVASFDDETLHSRIKVCEIEAGLLENALQTARKHDAKLTAVLQHLAARALGQVITGTNVTNFVSQTAVNMRRSIGVSAYEMGEYASACYAAHPRGVVDATPGPLSDEAWEAARVATRRLAKCSTRLTDQPIGLLRYLSSTRKWLQGKLGQQRDCSFEVSNVGACDPNGDGKGQARIETMFFAQPGHVVGSPLNFNLISVKGGSLVCTVTWPMGALGVPEDEEEGFVDEICSSLKSDLRRLK